MGKIICTENFDEFLSKGTEIIVQKALESIKTRGRFSLVLSGGRTPRFFFDKFATYFSDKLDWGKVDFFWLDERCVPPNDVNSNYGLAHRYLISKLPQTGTVHRIFGELNPAEAAQQYKNEIDRYFAEHCVSSFDLALIGMGEDGHIASIFPNSKETLLNKGEMVYATQEAQKGFFRITLSLDMINATKYKILLANNEEKSKVYIARHRNLPVHSILYDEVLTIV